MTNIKKTALAVALLAGSALSPLPLMAQTSGGQTSGTNVLPQQTQQSQQEAPKSHSSAQAKPQAGTSGTGKDAAQTKPTTEQQKSAGADQSQSAPASSSQRAQTDQMKKDSAEATEPGKAAASPNAASSTQRQSAQGSAKSTDADASKPSPARNATSPSTDTTASGTQNQNPKTAAARAERPSNEVTGSINISVEQKTEIRNVIVENKVETVKPSFSVSVGVSVPKTVKLHPLPPKVVEIVPAYRSYQYFLLADNRIVIVDPDSFEIVFILVV